MTPFHNHSPTVVVPQWENSLGLALLGSRLKLVGMIL